MAVVSTGNWENENLSQIPFRVLRGHNDGVTSCHFCINDSKIVTASRDGSVRLWNTELGATIQNIRVHSLPVTKAKLRVSKLLSSSWDKSVCLTDPETSDVIWSVKGEGIVTSCDISSNENLVVASSDLDNSVKLWDMRSGLLVANLLDLHSSTPTSCCFSPNDQRIASTGMSMTTKIWDLVSKKTTISLIGHKNLISNCCFSTNERYLCTSSWDKTLQLWDISTGMYRLEGATNLLKGHEGSITSCVFSSDAQYLISGGCDDAIVVWDMSVKSKKIVLKGHDGWVTGVDCSADRNWVLSSSQDRTVRVWNIQAADQIPAVLEHRKTMGLKIVVCEKCSKPFSIAMLEDPQDLSICVFCRLADPKRYKLPCL
uniref:WD repeat-containing protein 88-like n=1 Tax=Ciona intestinalis TaxID=7719 RepID=UPI000180B2E4|nr:WD repeat-containing protein 88-like [Ciona intestinalis]|eukprot:XP_026696028.1 WD repeat-containing protein 88-like [Ciona intestinalis]